MIFEWREFKCVQIEGQVLFKGEIIMYICKNGVVSFKIFLRESLGQINILKKCRLNFVKKIMGWGGVPQLGRSFLAHLSWKLKWAFLIAPCPSFVNFYIFNFFFRTTGPIFNLTWHTSSLGEGDANLFKWRG
jgi:hypothetical protein